MKVWAACLQHPAKDPQLWAIVEPTATVMGLPYCSECVVYDEPLPVETLFQSARVITAEGIGMFELRNEFTFVRLRYLPREADSNALYRSNCAQCGRILGQKISPYELVLPYDKQFAHSTQ